MTMRVEAHRRWGASFVVDSGRDLVSLYVDRRDGAPPTIDMSATEARELAAALVVHADTADADERRHIDQEILRQALQ